MASAPARAPCDTPQEALVVSLREVDGGWLPRVGGKVVEAPTWNEVTAILAVASPAARLAFALSAFAGLRRGEVPALRVESPRSAGHCHGVAGYGGTPWSPY